ncbi:hypothetical protein [Comamonas thiooxydans]|uniref:hypothetical protein n=1 Tax=Comamonas thiooxydans TaxID=363952 RepID=UPI0001BB17A2|nr:hypothetical protein [Comamonas thiooxydans]ACY33174.1 hypothetical protein CtCNB1_2428 [Comamonas thiooxydans]MDO1475519.1 hypothetical protein [Comamonas thiooxydans]
MPKTQIQFATLAFPVKMAAAAAPQPTSSGERYLLALLDSQRALDVALDALIARAAIADQEESAYIEIQKGNIKADYLKLDAMLNAYLSSQAIFKPISEQELTNIREILDRMQALTAQKDKASAIMQAVTDLLNQWSPGHA